MLKVAICDDNMDELSAMSTLIEEYRTLNQMDYEYTSFCNGFELLAELEKGGPFDVYCLDIIMPNFSGIDLAKEIRMYDKNAQIIFFTSSPEFALESYTVKAVNYVLKPVTREKLFNALTDVIERTQIEQASFVVVKSNEGISKILLSHLEYVEAMGKKVFYHMRNGKTVECYEQFSMVCKNLITKGHFIQVHRSYLVNINFIDVIQNSQIVLQTGTLIPIARGKTKEIKNQYLTFQMRDEI